MARRLQLHEKFCNLLGSRNVYFQPPESVKLNYDCIIYNVMDRNDIKADDEQYRGLIGYNVVFIHRDPDSILPERILNEFSRIRYVRSYTVDNLHHDAYRIYY